MQNDGFVGSDIDNYIQRFEQLIRRHADRIQQVKEAWNTFAWQLAMQMRSGVTFKQASSDILQDTIQLTDILSQPVTKKPRNDRSPKGKGKGKYKSDRQPYSPTRFPRRFNAQPYQAVGVCFPTHREDDVSAQEFECL